MKRVGALVGLVGAILCGVYPVAQGEDDALPAGVYRLKLGTLDAMEWLPGKGADGGNVRNERLQRPKQPRRQQRAQQDDGDGIQANGLGRSQLRFGRAVEFLWQTRLQVGLLLKTATADA